VSISDNNCTQTFLDFIGTPVLEESTLKHCWSAWNNTYFGNQQREFLFKFFNNILGLNARVTHFALNVSAECTVCIANQEPLPIQAETFLHLFYDCCHSGKYRKMAESEFFPEIERETDENKKVFWLLGVIPVNGSYVCNRFMQAAVFTINFLIWKTKLSKINVPVSILRFDFIYMCRCMLIKSVRLREAKTNAHFFLCRQNI
jgi:hypothetical protein